MMWHRQGTALLLYHFVAAEKNDTQHQNGHGYERKVKRFCPSDVLEQITYQPRSQRAANGRIYHQQRSHGTMQGLFSRAQHKGIY